jgi:hypothetical protein
MRANACASDAGLGSAELAGLAALRHQLRWSSRARVVAVCGPAGCGKTTVVRRALSELASAADGRECWTVLEWEPGWDGPMPSARMPVGGRLVVHVDSAESAVASCRGAGTAMMDGIGACLAAAAAGDDGAAPCLVFSLTTPLPPNGPGTRALQAVMRAVERAAAQQLSAVVRIDAPTARDVAAALRGAACHARLLPPASSPLSSSALACARWLEASAPPAAAASRGYWCAGPQALFFAAGRGRRSRSGTGGAGAGAGGGRAGGADGKSRCASPAGQLAMAAASVLRDAAARGNGGFDAGLLRSVADELQRLGGDLTTRRRRHSTARAAVRGSDGDGDGDEEQGGGDDEAGGEEDGSN